MIKFLTVIVTLACFGAHAQSVSLHNFNTNQFSTNAHSLPLPAGQWLVNVNTQKVVTFPSLNTNWFQTNGYVVQLNTNLGSAYSNSVVNILNSNVSVSPQVWTNSGNALSNVDQSINTVILNGGSVNSVIIQANPSSQTPNPSNPDIIVIGDNALDFTGNDVIAIGNGPASAEGLTANNLIAIGRLAGSSLTNAEEVIAIGHDALEGGAHIRASQSVFIGDHVGIPNDSGLTNVVGLGSRAGPTVNNQMVLGHGISNYVHNGVASLWPATNGLPNQALVTDGGTPQQLSWNTFISGITGGTTNFATTNTSAGLTNAIQTIVNGSVNVKTNYLAFSSPNTNTLKESIMFQTNGTTEIAMRNGDTPDGSAALSFKVIGKQTSETVKDWLDSKYSVSQGDYEIMTDKGSSGTARPLTLGAGGVRYWTIPGTGVGVGDILPINNAAQSIGASSDGILNLYIDGRMIFEQNGTVGVGQLGNVANANGSGLNFQGTRIGFVDVFAGIDSVRIETATISPPSKRIVDIGSCILAAGSATGSRNSWFGQDALNTGNRWAFGTNCLNAAQPAANQIMASVGSGSHVFGGDLGVYGGVSTGSGTNGALILGTAEGGAAISTQNTPKIREYWAPEPTILTESTPTTVCTVSNITTGKKGTVYVTATTVADDGTQQQSVGEKFAVSFGNVSGTVGTPVVSASSIIATFTSSGTLTTAWTAAVNANSINIQNSAASSLTQTTLTTRWHIEIDTDAVPHIYDVGLRHL